MGLRLRGVFGADAIHQRVLRGHHLRVVWLDFAARATRAAAWRHFPARGDRILEHIPETVLERVIGPLSAVIMKSNAVMRRLQHGSLQSYIVYVLAGLIALGFWP